MKYADMAKTNINTNSMIIIINLTFFIVLRSKHL